MEELKPLHSFGQPTAADWELAYSSDHLLKYAHGLAGLSAMIQPQSKLAHKEKVGLAIYSALNLHVGLGHREPGARRHT